MLDSVDDGRENFGAARHLPSSSMTSFFNSSQLLLISSAFGTAFITPACIDQGNLRNFQAEVTTYAEGRKAAYSIIHTDTCSLETDALFTSVLPTLNESNLKIGLALVGGLCAEKSPIQELQAALNAGHELINQSWSNTSLINCSAEQERDTCPVSSSNFDDEIKRTNDWLESSLDYLPSYMVFPENHFNQDARDYLESEGFLGAQAGSEGVHTEYIDDPFRGAFSAAESDASVQETEGAGRQAYVDELIAQGAWGIQPLKSLNFLENESLENDNDYLEYLIEKVDSEDLWIAPPSTITRYIQSREHCGRPSVKDYVLSFEGADELCEKYRTNLTVTIQREHMIFGILATQNGEVLPSWAKDRQRAFIANIDPRFPVELNLDAPYTGSPAELAEKAELAEQAEEDQGMAGAAGTGNQP
ncbi:MAG: polysaccharide deacetylase family protein [Polyangiaceae bacterium]|nr:polysaccharide deacetylase family protein [Polyangiaceae bacterium]